MCGIHEGTHEKHSINSLLHTYGMKRGESSALVKYYNKKHYYNIFLLGFSTNGTQWKNTTSSETTQDRYCYI